MINNNTNPPKKQDITDSKPQRLAKILYKGLIRLKATKEAQRCGRNGPIGLDFGQPERVNALVSQVDKEEINDDDQGE
jgi:hypothetical protein